MVNDEKYWPALIVPSPALITLLPGIFDRFTPLPVNKFLNKVGLNVSNNMPRNPHFSFFALFWTDLRTPFLNNPKLFKRFDCLYDIIHFLFEIINAVIPDQKILFWIVASVAALLLLILMDLSPFLTNIYLKVLLFALFYDSSWYFYINWWIICEDFTKFWNFCIR